MVALRQGQAIRAAVQPDVELGRQTLDRGGRELIEQELSSVWQAERPKAGRGPQVMAVSEL